MSARGRRSTAAITSRCCDDRKNQRGVNRDTRRSRARGGSSRPPQLRAVSLRTDEQRASRGSAIRPRAAASVDIQLRTVCPQFLEKQNCDAARLLHVHHDSLRGVGSDTSSSDNSSHQGDNARGAEPDGDASASGETWSHHEFSFDPVRGARDPPPASILLNCARFLGVSPGRSSSGAGVNAGQSLPPGWGRQIRKEPDAAVGDQCAGRAFRGAEPGGDCQGRA
jgi:hypothetical protein